MASKRPEWKDSKYEDAEGKFKELGCDALANWLIRSRNRNKKAIVGSLNQQIVFNRKKNPSLRWRYGNHVASLQIHRRRLSR